MIPLSDKKKKNVNASVPTPAIDKMLGRLSLFLAIIQPQIKKVNYAFRAVVSHPARNRGFG